MYEYPRHNSTGQKQHTNPRARLKQWEAREVCGHVWCFGKHREAGRRVYRQTLASATVLRDIWTTDEEQRLNTEIEQAAEPGLEQLTEGTEPCLDADQRQAVARYLMSLFRRGWQELAAQPERLRLKTERLETKIRDAGFRSDALDELRACIAELRTYPPGRPMPIEIVSDAIAAMRWTVLECPDATFVNSDSPVQIVPSVIIRRNCELTTPLTPTRALVCDWGVPQPWIAVRTATPAEVAAVNSRTAGGAESFVYLARSLDEESMLQATNGPALGRIHDFQGRRFVPWRHRVSIELGARLILDGCEEDTLALVEYLKDVASQWGQLLDKHENSQSI